MMLDILKMYVHITSPLAIVIVVAVVTLWLFARPASRWPPRVLLLLLGIYYVLATPFGSEALTSAVAHGLSSLNTREAAQGADMIVVMGGGAENYRSSGIIVSRLSVESVLRALEVVRVYRLLGNPTVIATGGSVFPDRQPVPEALVMHQELVKAGIPDAKIIDEAQSRTTHEQAADVGEILKAHGTTRFVLVTSPAHMWRSIYAFRALGFDPVPSVSPMHSDLIRPQPFMPNGGSLRLSDAAIYDLAALGYYWARGWLG